MNFQARFKPLQTKQLFLFPDFIKCHVCKPKTVLLNTVVVNYYMYMSYKPNTADACYYEMNRHEAKLATNIRIAQLNLFLQSYRTLSE